jgi:hypothetical protein
MIAPLSGHGSQGLSAQAPWTIPSDCREKKRKRERERERKTERERETKTRRDREKERERERERELHSFLAARWLPQAHANCADLRTQSVTNDSYL